MVYAEVKNAARPLLLGTIELTPEPVILRSGMWLGVLKIDDELGVKKEDILAHPRVLREVSKSEYSDLKKKKQSSYRTEVIEPEPQDADPVEKPEKLEEVLIEGKADMDDLLSDEPPKKRRRAKAKA